MEQRDYLLREINKIGELLARMASYLLGLKAGTISTIRINNIRRTLIDEIDLDLDSLLGVSLEELIDFLLIDKKLHEDHLEKLAELLYIIAGNLATNNPQREAFYIRSLAIYEYVEKAQQTFSFERQMKLEQIKAELK